jgi:geranylgeranyl reductase family protein
LADGEAFDVVVVGAGPAGSRAAAAAAREGADVLLVERRQVVGTPVQCAEFLTRRALLDLAMPSSVVAQDVERTVTYVLGERASVRRNPGCIIHRDVFDSILADRATDAGARLLTATSVEGPIERDGTIVRIHLRGGGPGGTRTLCAARALIGADGPTSTVGSAVGRRVGRFLVGSQVTAELHEPGTDTEVYFDKPYVGGYAWLFPKGEVANVGVGVDASAGGDAKGALEHLVRSLGDRIGTSVRSTGGLIPVSGPLECVDGNVVLVGDAAGHTNPITGGGIHQAVEAGSMAGAAAARYISGDGAALEAYSDAFASLFGRTLSRATARREELSDEWPDAVDDEEALRALVRRTWIGFNDYYKDPGHGEVG